jgi:hypothetical protein
MMTERHNRVAQVVKEAVLKFVGENLRSDIHENITIAKERLPDGLRTLRPDIVFERERNGGRVTEILECSCPYGYVSHGRDTLATVYEQKKAKYSNLAKALRILKQQPVNVTAIIVSSMGAVSPQSLKELRKILGCSSREAQKLGRRMSDAAITGPFKIWRQYAQKMKRGPTGEGEEEAVLRQERRDAIEFDESERERRKPRKSQGVERIWKKSQGGEGEETKRDHTERTRTMCRYEKGNSEMKREQVFKDRR